MHFHQSSFLTALVAAAASIAPALAGEHLPILPNPADLPALQFDGTASYRQFRANDTTALPFNISTYVTSKNFTTTDGVGMYGWNLLFTGNAYNPSRPLLVVMGSSVSRSHDVSDPVDVMNYGLGETWSYRIRTRSPYVQAILSDAGIGVLNIVSPWCYNTTTKSPLRNACLDSKSRHWFRHYRPDNVIEILNQVQSTFGFDPEKLVGSGTSMGARGILRTGTAYPHFKAISIVGGNLETAPTIGEVCFDLNTLTSNPKQACKNPVGNDLDLAYRLASTKVQIYASYGDNVANVTTRVVPTCNAINNATAAPPPTSAPTTTQPTSNATCQIRMEYTPRAKGQLGPVHELLCGYSFDPVDLNWLISGYGGEPVRFATS
ncbi:hypothetical protein OC846_006548 [Tilletia horrida]|uniref:Feruloyl esterase n=1 Tax=Tilletia horrida TaxID=155126 RepID=A0AAN6GJ95_9BASI|nr:hypothetical protein OC846_006548 [Tilletia horrida]KAK0561146.1 hypothetical protein OC861_005961 [Tilletia horrida]